MIWASHTIMPDRFQFYSKSADSSPGKGTGEVKSSTETYDTLTAIPGWRKILSNSSITPFAWKGATWQTADQAFESVKGAKHDVLVDIWKNKFTGNKVAQDVLLGTGDAELWSGKTRWAEGETLRKELCDARLLAEADTQKQKEELKASAKRNISETTDMSDKPKKSRKKNQVQQDIDQEGQGQEQVPVTASPIEGTGSDVTQNSPNVLAAGVNVSAPSNLQEIPVTADQGLRQELAFTAQVEKTRDSSIRFCTVCSNYLYLHVDETTGDLQRSCRNCGYKDTADQGGLVSEMRIEQLSAEGYNLINEFTLLDPRLPHLHGTMKCINTSCQSNKAGAESDIVYIKYDTENLRYMYICTFCKANWRSRR
jgi:hypothetical protein